MEGLEKLDRNRCVPCLWSGRHVVYFARRTHGLIRHCIVLSMESFSGGICQRAGAGDIWFVSRLSLVAGFHVADSPVMQWFVRAKNHAGRRAQCGIVDTDGMESPVGVCRRLPGLG